MKKIKNPTACIIIIGNEILSGRTIDTNKNYLCKELNIKGIDVIEARVIKDNIKHIIDTVNQTRKKYDYIFTTGGIGPTHDDLTALSIAKAFKVKLVKNKKAIHSSLGAAAFVENYSEMEGKGNTALRGLGVLGQEATPIWDRGERELRAGGSVIKRFCVPAPNQELILTAFQEEGWPKRIDDPLPPTPEMDAKLRLRKAFSCLNRNRRFKLVHFHGDGRGRGRFAEPRAYRGR